MKIPYSISDRSLTFYVSGRPYGVDRSNPAYVALKELVQADDPDIERLIALTNPVEAIQTLVDNAVAADYLPRGVVGVGRDAITYNGTEVHGVLVDRIFDMLEEGFDIMPMVRFLENLMTNPADFARDELYLWLEKSDLPITEDGHFLAYKMVQADFTSIHDSTTDNTPGVIVSMPRQEVDPVRDHTCSRGLHFCSKSYLPLFGDWNKKETDNVVVLLKINPADVVSIPSDYNNAKGRAWKYEVLQVVDFDSTKVWGAVYVEPAAEVTTDPSQDLLEFPSDLASALYAALNEIGISTKSEDREARLDWADNALYETDDTEDKQDWWNRPMLESFKELTLFEASRVLEYARALKADQDAVTEGATLSKVSTAEQARVNAINGYGIETLRRKASKAGLLNAYKGGYKVKDLRTYLIDHASKPV